MNKILYLIIGIVLTSVSAFAGNPDRQGEAGAYELLMNPWAKSAGLHTMNTAGIAGVESMRLNVAGLSRLTGKTEVLFSSAIYLEGTDIQMNAFGLSQKTKNGGAFGVSIMAVDFGDIAVTTEDQPEGTGATYSPAWVNIGLGYSHQFENKVSVGVLVRVISESLADLNAFGFAIDAGVQYVAGEEDNFKFGISLRNVGSPMEFGGEGLSEQLVNGDGTQLTFNRRASDFELPSILHIGTSYDFLLDKSRITVLGNFTSNSFSQDQLGAGVEFALNEMFMLRGGYKYTFGQGQNGGIEDNVYTGLSGGLSVMVPFKKGGDRKIGIDYAYRASNPWGGTHNFGVRLAL